MKTNQCTASWFCVTAAAFLFLIPPAHTLAGTRALPFQGRVSDASGNAVPDGARVVQFKIYDAPVGGRAVWNGEVQNLTINAGLVSTLLGTKATLAGVDFNQDLYLEITIDANGDGQITLADPPLLPRQSILPAVFAHESANARLLDNYDWSALFGTNNPADGTLLQSKIGDSTLGSSKLQDGAVTSAKIANGAVSLPKLDTTGATSGQSLTYNGTNVAWNQVNALNAESLKGFDWSSIFSDGNPQTGNMDVANANARGVLSAGGDFFVNGRSFLSGPVVMSGKVLAPDIGLSMSMNDWSIYFRGVGDFNHYLAWGNAQGATTGFDGPVLAGLGGGVLGSTFDWTLRWNRNGSVVTRGAIFSGSDRNIKTNFTSIDPSEILNKVLTLPVTGWSYKDDPGANHIGPVAQDFYAAFGLGTDDKFIATVDADGVSLAAIKGLNQKVEETDNELRALIREQKEQIKALQTEMAALKTAH